MMTAQRLFAVASLAFALAPCSAAYAAPQEPDLVLLGGKVFTADTTRPWAEAVAIRGERIVGVGTTAAMRALAGPRTRIIDVGGRVVTPGFNDAHDHVNAGSPGVTVPLGGEQADLSGVQVLDSLRGALARHPAGTWIRASLWTRALDDTVLRRSALDRIAPDHPVILTTGWGHGMILNSAAMRALEIREDERDPLGGWYERDARGRLTGRLDEYAGWRALRRFRAMIPETTMVQNLRRFAQRDLQLGLTSVQDMPINLEPATAARVYRAAELPLRVHIYKFSMPTASSLNLNEWANVSARPAPMVVITGRKWILDGTPLDGFMLTRGPQKGRRPEWRGRLDFPVDSVRVMLTSALRSREQLALHIVGDSAISLVLSLMESVAPDSAWRPLRIRFEHGGIIWAPDLWSRAKAKGVVLVANLQLAPPPEVVRMLPKAELDTMGMMLDPKLRATFRMGLGSDGVARSPFVGMFMGLSISAPPNAREMLVRAYTWGSAYAEFAEKEKGTIAPGMLADIAVLSQDIFTVPIDALPRTESALTIVGGKIVWDAGTLK